MVSTPRRISSLHAAVPTNPAPPITNALVTKGAPAKSSDFVGYSHVEVAGGELYIDAFHALEPRSHLLRHRHRTMPAAGASECDDEPRAAALAVMRKRVTERALQVVEEIARRRLLQHELAHARVAAVQRTQLVDPVRVVEQPHIHYPRGAVRYAPLVAERETGDEHPLA